MKYNEILIILIIIFFMILIIDYMNSTCNLEHFSWLRKKYNKIKKSIGNVAKKTVGVAKKGASLIKHVTPKSYDTFMKFGKTIIKPDGTIGKIIATGREIAKKLPIHLPLPMIHNTGEKILSNAELAIINANNLKKEIARNITNRNQSLLKCRGSHFYLNQSTCPPTRKYSWPGPYEVNGVTQDGTCCNSFALPIT